MTEPVLEPAGPATPSLVRQHLDNLSAASAPDDKLWPYCWATNAWLRTLPVWSDPPTKAVELGAVMLVGRLWRRRGSPGGIDSITEAGPVYVARFDPDISRLLALNAPQVG